MLSENDLARIITLLVATAEVIGDEARPSAVAMMAGDLGEAYSLPVIEKALAACRRELKGRLSLAAILERIDDGHPAPNEAWALSLKAIDERETIVWTGEMQRAWGIARAAMEVGDKYAGRLAFIEAYTEELKRARAESRPAQFTISLGDDKAGRDVAVRAAVSRGQLQQHAVQHLLLAAPAAAPSVLQIAASGSSVAVGEDAGTLRIGIDPSAAPPDMRERFAALAGELRDRERQREEARHQALLDARAATARRQQELQAQYEQASKQQGGAGTTV